MLLIFEATLCAQRFRSLEHLRNVKRPPRHVFVLREHQWRACSSEDLVPGDVASFSVSSTMTTRQSRGVAAQSVYAPCDAVVLWGSCVVNEAMLTGESVPQRKDALVFDEALGEDSAVGCLEVDSSHRRHVIFGGTEILDTSLLTSSGVSGSVAAPVQRLSLGSLSATRERDAYSLIPPDRGVVVHVVRTGFETSQGQLMRLILYATERVVGSTDSAAFIGVLLMFAVAAALYVLYEGLKDDTPRNRFKLCLHVSSSVLHDSLVTIFRSSACSSLPPWCHQNCRWN